MSETVHSSAAELRRPSRFFAEGLRDLTRSGGVAWQLFRSNMQARHRRAGLGYLWLLLPTVATTAVWMYVQSRGIIEVGASPVPYPVYVLAGTVLWQVFVDALNAPLQQLGSGRQMITRSRVPHEALILAGAIEVLVNCAVRLALLAAVLAAFGVPVGAGALLLPVGVAALATLGLAIGLLLAPAGMLYDDVGRAITIVTTFWFFLTPVIYPVPQARVVRLNPVTPLLDTTRAWLIAGPAPAPAASGFAAVAALAALALVLAWLLHRLARPHVVARLG